MRLAALASTTQPSGACVQRRVAGLQRRGLGGEGGDELVGDAVVDDDALGRHADLALVHEGAESGGGDRRVDVGVVEHDQRRLAAELEQRGLEVAAGDLGDDPADAGRAGEVDAADGRLGDQRLDDRGRVIGGVGDGVEHARGQPGLVQRVDDQPVGARADLGGLHHHGVAAGERRRQRADAEDDRGVPGRHRRATTPAGWRTAMASEPGRFEGMISPVIWVVSAAASRSMSEASMTLKCAQPAVAPISLGHRGDEFGRLGGEDVGGLREDGAALARRGAGPVGEGGGGGVDGGDGVVDGGGGGLGRHGARDRVAALEGGAVRGFGLLVRDQQSDGVHGGLLQSQASGAIPRKACCTAGSSARRAAGPSPTMRPASSR